MGRPAPLPAPARTRSAATARSSCAAPAALGIQARVGPVAIANGRFGNRPHCIYRGFCLQGCKVNAKASPLITHIPDALAHGAEVRADCMVTRCWSTTHRPGDRRQLLSRDGVEHRQRARLVAVAGYSIETPRLLLLSATRRYPDGLGNDHDQVGRYLMVQGAPQTAGRFDDEIRMYKAPPPEVSQRAVLRDRPDQAVPARLVHPDRQPAADHLGRARRRPRTLGRRCCASTCATTCTGPPSARCASSCPNPTTGSPWPTRPTATACRWRTSPTASATTTSSSSRPPRACMEDILRAAGASEVMTIDRYAHLVGGAPHGRRREDGVVDAEHRVFGVAEPLHRRRQRAAHPRARPTRR